MSGDTRNDENRGSSILQIFIELHDNTWYNYYLGCTRGVIRVFPISEQSREDHFATRGPCFDDGNSRSCIAVLESVAGIARRREREF
jgi:hypothetical protein